MQDEKKFMEMLYDLVDMARVNGNSITIEEVDGFFEELSLNEKQKDAVYDYLCKGHIKVIGYTTVTENDAAEDDGAAEAANKNDAAALGALSDKTVLDSPRTKHYRKTVKEMAAADSDLKKIYERTVSGGSDDETAESIINAYLPVVIHFSSKYSGRGVAGDELIQEGNLALLLAVKNIMSGSDCSMLKSFRSFDAYIRDSIRNGIIDHINSEIGREGELQVVIGKAQLVKDAATYLSKELGRVASVRELSEYTHIPDDEINDIIRFSGNVLPFGDGNDLHT
ncbi:MAG: hypothetical protein HFH14_09880 [Lachnospiraceae bacterium]|nr:hypothetical protein [Lachnospiraceae bacterium]